jgi:two-component system chemotaxis response regulator CheY
MRELIKDALQGGGFEIIGEAEDGAGAVLKYQALKPDLVTMDIVMNKNMGIDAIKEIISKDPDAKVLVISALGNQGIIIDAIKAGAMGFIIKPFKNEILLEEVKRVLGE